MDNCKQYNICNVCAHYMRSIREDGPRNTGYYGINVDEMTDGAYILSDNCGIGDKTFDHYPTEGEIEKFVDTIANEAY